MSTYPPPSTEAITPGMVQALGQTKPWVRFISILGFVGAGFMVLGAAGLMITAIAGGMGRRGPLGGMEAGVGVMYLLFALLYVPPSVFLFRYASAIGRILPGNEAEGIERALVAQKSFWRFVGIMALVIIVLYVLIIGVVVVMAAMGAARRF